MLIQSCCVVLIVSLSIVADALHVGGKANRLFDRRSDDETTEDGQKVELPKDCGSFKTLLSRRHHSHHRIHSGYEAKSGQFPSYVQLYLADINDPAGYELCGGTIITSRHILTAAHCTQATKLENSKVGAGLLNYRLRSKTFESDLEKVCSSSNFKLKKSLRGGNAGEPDGPHFIFDVAIVKIKDEFEFNDEIQPACLPQSQLASDRQAYSIGLGANYSIPLANNSTEPDTLQVLPVKSVECPLEHQHETIMCNKANNPEHMGVVCEGDSGGPVMSLDEEGRQTVYGIHSYGPVFCMDYPQLEPELDEQLKDLFYLGFNVDVYNARQEIDQLLEECA